MSAVPQGPTFYAQTLPAGENLNAKQFYFVKKSAGTYVACTAATDLPAGVLQNNPELGERKGAEWLTFTPIWARGRWRD